MTRTTPESWHARAIAAERGGDPTRARELIERALAEFPGNADLHNSAGNLAMRRGEPGEAARHFEAALAARPDALEFALNLAIALTGAGRAASALRVLMPFEAQGTSQPRYCSVRAAAERGAGRPGEAARWYDVCLRLDPGHRRALHGRARTALERGEAGALARIDAALAANPAEADLWLARAQALDVAGETTAAREIAQQLVAQAPQWLEGLRFLAQLRHAAGETGWAAHYADAARLVPQDIAIPIDHISVLAGLDFAAEAAEIAASARQRFDGDPQLALLEAVNAGFAGDDDRADAIFASLELSTAARWAQEARHRLRLRDPEHALAAAERALELCPWDIAAWAMRGIAWRLTGNDRAAWLHEQDGLVRLLPLADDDGVLPAVISRLQDLHDNSPMPLGQSLRGGSQTRGILFHRLEPEFAALQRMIMATLEVHRQQLPPRDEGHPLLRHRDTPWLIHGSWSVRLLGGGDHHTAHIHPQGVLSSACYLILPQQRLPGDGALEIGRPAPDLRLDLPPVKVIEPQVAHLALFPSTLYHGTTAFGHGQRMTVAFDVVPDGEPD